MAKQPPRRTIDCIEEMDIKEFISKYCKTYKDDLVKYGNVIEVPLKALREEGYKYKDGKFTRLKIATEDGA